MKKCMLFVFMFSMFYVCKAEASNVAVNTLPPASLMLSSTTSSNGTATVTISTPVVNGPYSTGFYNYITDLHVVEYATSTVSGSSVPVSCTATNLVSGSTPNWYFPTAVAVGAVYTRDILFNPIQAVQGDQVIFSCPATVGIAWDLKVGYYQGR